MSVEPANLRFRRDRYDTIDGVVGHGHDRRRGESVGRAKRCEPLTGKSGGSAVFEADPYSAGGVFRKRRHLRVP